MTPQSEETRMIAEIRAAFPHIASGYATIQDPYFQTLTFSEQAYAKDQIEHMIMHIGCVAARLELGAERTGTAGMDGLSQRAYDAIKAIELGTAHEDAIATLGLDIVQANSSQA